jgi:hypothetical protein
VALDRPRHLDRRAGRGYTDDPTYKLPGEPEPVDEDFQRLISTAVRARFEHERAQERARRENKSRSARLRSAQSEALALGVDGRSELRHRHRDRPPESEERSSAPSGVASTGLVRERERVQSGREGMERRAGSPTSLSWP